MLPFTHEDNLCNTDYRYLTILNSAVIGGALDSLHKGETYRINHRVDIYDDILVTLGHIKSSLNKCVSKTQYQPYGSGQISDLGKLPRDLHF